MVLQNQRSSGSETTKTILIGNSTEIERKDLRIEILKFLIMQRITRMKLLKLHQLKLYSVLNQRINCLQQHGRISKVSRRKNNIRKSGYNASCQDNFSIGQHILIMQIIVILIQNKHSYRNKQTE